MKNKIGFIGVGTMGKPMASNLLKNGFDVFTCAHKNFDPIKELENKGAVVLDSIRKVAEQSDTVVTCLPASIEVEEVLFSAEGIASSQKEDLVVIDTSTIHPLDAQRFSKKLISKNIHLLDSPMSGGEVGAIAGSLVFMVGGNLDAFDARQNIYNAMGQKAYYVGESGMGAAVKICNNMMLGINLIGVSEAFTLGAKIGVDPLVMAEIVQASSGGSAVIERYFPKTIAKNQYQPGFMLKLMAKDMNLALLAAKDLGVPSFAGNISGQVFDLVQSMGKGEMDFTVVSTLFQEAANVIIGKNDETDE